MGWIFFFFPWGINKKNPPNYPPKMSENHLISPLQHCCPSVFSCLCFPQFHQKSSSSPVFPHSGPSPPLPGVNMSHWGNACEHSQNQRWVRQKTVIWARFREWPVIAGFRNSLKQRHVWRVWRDATHTSCEEMSELFLWWQKTRESLLRLAGCNRWL